MNDNTNKAYYKAEIGQLRRDLSEAGARMSKQLAAMKETAPFLGGESKRQEQIAKLQSIFADEVSFNRRMLAKLDAIENHHSPLP